MLSQEFFYSLYLSLFLSLYTALWIISSDLQYSSSIHSSAMSNLLVNMPISSFFFKLIYYLFLAALGLPCDARASHYDSLSCCGARALGAQASVGVACGPSCSAACGIFPDQGSNPCPLHWQAGSQPLRHQRSPH